MKVHQAAVGELTAGDGVAYTAATRGQGAAVQQTVKPGTGALEGARAHQSETDDRETQPSQARR